MNLPYQPTLRYGLTSSSMVHIGWCRALEQLLDCALRVAKIFVVFAISADCIKQENFLYLIKKTIKNIKNFLT